MTLWSPRADAAERRARALATTRTILAADIHLPHRRELLSICLWKVTEADSSKYGLRYRSQASIGRPTRELAHEHVFRRKLLIQALIERPDDAETIIERAVACVVTRDEHARLSAVDRADPHVDGWLRYRRAAITVIDGRNGTMVTLPDS